jgi:hypothetical protein
VPRRRKEKKRKEKKRLERIPEKLQRKRERQERYQVRRMPGWIRTSLVVVVLVVIIVGAIIIWPRYIPPPSELEPGRVEILQQDNFYIFINESGQVNVDYLQSRYGAGTHTGDQPLNVTFQRIFDETEVNFTFPEYYVFYDYYGNAYNIVPDTDANSIEYTVNWIKPNFLQDDPEIPLIGSQITGYWSLFWDYYLNSSDNTFLAEDNLSDLFSFNFTISMENDTLIYNTPTIVHCNVTFNTGPDTNEYNYGNATLIFPKQIYNETILLANITLADVIQVGDPFGGDLTPSVDNETYLGFHTNFDIALSANTSWGLVFDLNVTAFTNSSFCLLDFTTPNNEYFLQSGYTGTIEEQPMHFPKADITIDTPRDIEWKQNVTNLWFRFPQVWVNITLPGNSTPGFIGSAISLRMPTSRPLERPPNAPYAIEKPPFCEKVRPLHLIHTDTEELGFLIIPIITSVRRWLLP